MVPGFSIASAGDWGCSENTQRTVSNILSRNISLLLGLGDYSYRPTADCWQDLINPLEPITKIVIGNHDTRPRSLLNEYFNHFNLTNPFYSFNLYNVHFLVMSSETSFENSSEQYRFVNSDLEMASSDPRVDWIIVSFHRPAYTSPTHNEGDALLRDTYHPIFERYGVDMVLQGHNHNYQRTYPIKYNSTFSEDPIIENTGTFYYEDEPGIVFLTVGTGGQSLYPLKSKAFYVANQFDTVYGYILIEVDNNHQTEKYLNVAFHDSYGTIRDQFSITKN